jgi:MATE family multidrug resistance protein
MSQHAPDQQHAGSPGDGLSSSTSLSTSASTPNLSNKPPALELLGIAGPAVVTMVSYTVMQFVDMLIVAKTGPGAVAAVGNGGITAFVTASVLFGTIGLINTFASQSLGAGRPRDGAAYAWNGIWMIHIYWLLVMLPTAVAMPQLLDSIRTFFDVEADPDVTAMSVTYGRISLCGMSLVLAARALAHFFYGVQKAKWVMIGALLANAINVPVSLALVLGLWGLPRMGVAGAAIGTLVGVAIEFGVLLAVFLGPKFNREFGTRVAWRFSKRHCGDILRLGWPAGVMMGNELFCWWVFMGTFIAHFGTAHNEAGWMVLRYMHIAFMPAIGLSMAVTAVVGRVVGAGRHDLATSRMKLGLVMSMAYMGACAVAMIAFREPLIGLFAKQMAVDGVMDASYIQEVISIGGKVLIVAATFQLFDAMAITLVGALRGAGDTVWPGVVTAVFSWIWILGGGYVAMRYFGQLGSLGPWIGAAMFIITLSLALAWRWRSGKWKNIRVVDRDAPAVPEAAGEGAAVSQRAASLDVPHEEMGMTPDGLTGLVGSPECAARALES